MEYSPEALGQVIRELREARAPKLSQEELGRNAGYRTGAGVSMSRIENGMTRPGPRRLEGIAHTLGLSVKELETRGAQRSGESDRQHQHQPRARPGRRGPAQPDVPVSGPDGESTKDRMRRIQGDVDRRNTQAVTGGVAFNAAHDSARDDFFMELVRSATSITGLPVPAGPTATVRRTVGLSPTTEAALRRQVAAHGIAVTLASGAGAAAAESETDPESAYSAVVAAAMLAPVPAAAHQDQPTGATARATRALLGGGTHSGRSGIAAGTMLLTGFVASAASPLFAAGTLAWLARRSRRQNDQLRIELDQAEANLAATRLGFAAVMEILTRATGLMDYVAVHAAHALRRWQAQLSPGATRWSDLGRDQQRQYLAFVEVAACQVCVDSINMTELLAAPAEEQATLIQLADDILTLAQQQVEILI